MTKRVGLRTAAKVADNTPDSKESAPVLDPTIPYITKSERFRKEFWGRHLWARGYFAVSTGNITDEVIAEYIKN